MLAQFGVSSCARSVTHLSALPRGARRFLDLRGLNPVTRGVTFVSLGSRDGAATGVFIPEPRTRGSTQ